MTFSSNSQETIIPKVIGYLRTSTIFQDIDRDNNNKKMSVSSNNKQPQHNHQQQQQQQQL